MGYFLKTTMMTTFHLYNSFKIVILEYSVMLSVLVP